MTTLQSLRSTQGAGRAAETQSVPFENLRVDTHQLYRDGGTRVLTMRPQLAGLPLAPEAGQVRLDGAINSPTRGRFYFTPAGGTERSMTLDELSGLLTATKAQLDENPAWSAGQVSKHEGLIDAVSNAVLAEAGPNIHPRAPFSFADGFDS